MSAPLLEVEHLAVAFGAAQALTDVSFTVGAGHCMAVVGETGSGKTLTCRTLVGLEGRLGARVTGGALRYDGRDLVGLDERGWRGLRGREIALVPQASLSSLDPVRRVGVQVEETVRALDPEADPRTRTRELMEQVDMPRVAESLRCYPHELSGGMRQRAMIALALAGRPRLLLADEPTTALDVTVQRTVLRLLASVRAEAGMSLVFITHDLGIVRSIASEVAILYDGETVETGPTERVFAQPEHPYTRTLLAAQLGWGDAA